MTRGDVYPDDLQARHTVLAALRTLRHAQHMSMADVAEQLGVNEKAVHLNEKKLHDPRIARLQAHLRALNHRLRMRPIFDPDLPADRTTALFAHLADAEPDSVHADSHHRSAVLRHLVARRRWLDLTAQQVSASIDRSPSLISRIEMETKEPMLSSYQRYARALGGWLRLDLEHVPDLTDQIPALEGATP